MVYSARSFMTNKLAEILLAGPRGFCAGVERAIDIVELALAVCPPPVYVRKEIVHNRHVVDELREKGAIFVDELHEVPDDEDRALLPQLVHHVAVVHEDRKSTRLNSSH